MKLGWRSLSSQAQKGGQGSAISVPRKTRVFHFSPSRAPQLNLKVPSLLLTVFHNAFSHLTSICWPPGLIYQYTISTILSCVQPITHSTHALPMALRPPLLAPSMFSLFTMFWQLWRGTEMKQKQGNTSGNRDTNSWCYFSPLSIRYNSWIAKPQNLTF